MYKIIAAILLALFFLLVGKLTVSAQTDAFTYQGSLKDGASPANGNYDFAVEIYDSETGGAVVWSATLTNIPVQNGSYTLRLTAVSEAFNGLGRFIQIAVRRAGNGQYVMLNPRVPVDSAPYSIRSKYSDLSANSQKLGGFEPSSFAKSDDPRLSDSRMPLSGSSSYIQNSVSEQSNANFNISGSGIIGTQLGVGGDSQGWRLGVFDTGTQGLRVQTNSPGGAVASFGGFGSFSIDRPGFPGGRFIVTEAGSVGIGISNPIAKLHVVGQDIRVESGSSGQFPRFTIVNPFAPANAAKWQNYATGGALRFGALNDAENAETIWLQVERSSGTTIDRVNFMNGVVRVGQLGAAGSTSVCRNANGEFANCSSSVRYKTNIVDFTPGLDLVRRLRPVAFNWKADNSADLGFVAEEVAAAEPLLATRNEKGEVEGVKYDRVSAVLVNAVNEQQAQIDELRKENRELKERLAAIERRLEKRPEPEGRKP